MKIMGATEIEQILTPKAFTIYANLDPLDVIQEDGHAYSLAGLINLDTVSSRTLNRALERVYYSCATAAT